VSIPAAQSYEVGFVTSKDGTKISYRQLGTGPGLILVPGGMQAAQNFMKLGAALADSFTVSILNRRGRSPSGTYGEDHDIGKEVDDLDALVQKTGAQNLFGLSAGGLVLLQAALGLPATIRIALYEPPLVLAGDPRPLAWLPRYERELARGNLAGAMVAVMKGTADRGDLFTALPLFLLVPLMRLAIRTQGKDVEASDVPLDTLIRSIHFDLRNIGEMAGRLETFRALDAEVLLLGGTRSAPYLTATLDALSGILPHSRRVILPGLGHIAADDVGQPEHVAKELRLFFAASSPAPHGNSTETPARPL
jgi:pimeloyl-ACP methyl ester carboxylesterase